MSLFLLFWIGFILLYIFDYIDPPLWYAANVLVMAWGITTEGFDLISAAWLAYCLWKLWELSKETV